MHIDETRLNILRVYQTHTRTLCCKMPEMIQMDYLRPLIAVFHSNSISSSSCTCFQRCFRWKSSSSGDRTPRQMHSSAMGSHCQSHT